MSVTPQTPAAPPGGKPERSERPIWVPLIAVLAGFLVWSALTVFYVSWSVSQAQHTWCSTVTLLNNAPAPSNPPKGQDSPGRLYDQELAADFRTLQARLGC